MLAWEDDDLKVIPEINQLSSIFSESYLFSVEKWLIPASPASKPSRRTQERVNTFVDEWDSNENLLIVYYAGHAVPDDRNPGGAPIWRSK